MVLQKLRSICNYFFLLGVTYCSFRPNGFASSHIPGSRIRYFNCTDSLCKCPFSTFIHIPTNGITSFTRRQLPICTTELWVALHWLGHWNNCHRDIRYLANGFHISKIRQLSIIIKEFDRLAKNPCSYYCQLLLVQIQTMQLSNL